mmetsp:Transcript_12461/g.27577  ORF Transcript_12461/g.27577 Transcript_12461/m.27577 type:complete len:209 (+) Transcript_12461:50-676(+)
MRRKTSAKKDAEDELQLQQKACEVKGAVDLVSECLLNILLFRPGHDRRALSRLLRDTLDATWPVLFFGPPPLPARACYRVPIGAARASYGVWVKAHKAVSLETHLRPSKRSRQCVKWEQTVTKSSIAFGSVHEDGPLDPSISCGFWKAALRLLHSNISEPILQPPAEGGSGSISICFGGKEHRLEVLNEDLLYWIGQVEALQGSTETR